MNHVPLSVRTGNRRKRFNWWLQTQRERVAFLLAPWLRCRSRKPGAHWYLITCNESCLCCRDGSPHDFEDDE
jgi:hypothetical protein